MVALLALATLLAAASTLGSPPGPPTERQFTLVAMTGPCEGCYSFNGTIPGPTLDVNLGDTIVVTLVNQLADNASFHVHGMTIASSLDGVRPHGETQLRDSTAPPGGSFTYRFRASFAGTWHYHDHAVGGNEGQDGVHRGLYGAVLVRTGAEPRGSVIDMHFLDDGAHLSTTTAPAGQPLDIAVVGLGDRVWTIDFPRVGSVVVGPGMSERIIIPTPSGTYAWTATSDLFDTDSGEVVVS
jgi:FtsP/CotA-like multicopper oxidase with cupredoxin domain